MDLPSEVLQKHGVLIATAALTITGTALTLLSFLVQRYISQRDDFEEKTLKRLEEQSDAFGKKTEDLREKVAGIQEAAIEIREINLEFKTHVQKELHQVKSISAGYMRHLKTVSIHLTAIEKKYEKALAAVQKGQARADVHDSAIRGALKELKASREEFLSFRAEIETVIRKHGDDITIIGQRVRPRKD